ncbi:hypothetical protein L226DRAFT_272036 [Lentinus tigrinus ALCF2SS1-7]|uniref:uncharacterized protein n=1 Tax=Lentinus tigrinus ALCF2SS1-7 TaxID=1328758 RepID=UPI0011662D42|nr:hypothetical protein L226DRAFT_272036 [Lentinus tigrinus ALCF2SS1-7]
MVAVAVEVAERASLWLVLDPYVFSTAVCLAFLFRHRPRIRAMNATPCDIMHEPVTGPALSTERFFRLNVIRVRARQRQVCSPADPENRGPGEC